MGGRHRSHSTRVPLDHPFFVKAELGYWFEVSPYTKTISAIADH
jgi:hypothetical protein